MKFPIGVALCSIRLPYACSLKDRRAVVRSVVDGVRARFGISAADLGPTGSWKDARLGFAAASSSISELDERLLKLEKFIIAKEAEGEFKIVKFTREVFDYDNSSY